MHGPADPRQAAGPIDEAVLGHEEGIDIDFDDDAVNVHENVLIPNRSTQAERDLDDEFQHLQHTYHAPKVAIVRLMSALNKVFEEKRLGPFNHVTSLYLSLP